jgi:hypothetical protein
MGREPGAGYSTQWVYIIGLVVVSARTNKKTSSSSLYVKKNKSSKIYFSWHGYSNNKIIEGLSLVCVCVYYCSTYFKAVRVGGGG